MDSIPTNGTTQRNIEQRIRELIEGRNNATGTVTLTASATSTTVSKSTINANGAVFLFPTTAHAGAALAAGTTYATITTGGGSFTITHANNAQTDRTFYYVVLGG